MRPMSKYNASTSVDRASNRDSGSHAAGEQEGIGRPVVVSVPDRVMAADLRDRRSQSQDLGRRVPRTAPVTGGRARGDEPPRRGARSSSQPRIDGLAFEGEHAEHALVDAIEGLLADEALERFDAERERVEGGRSSAREAPC